MFKTTVDVDGMSCGMCEAHINETIRRAFPVKSVKSSHRKHCTVILSEQAIDEDELRRVIGDTGYQVEGVLTEAYKPKGFFHS